MNIKHIFATAALTLAATFVSAQSLFVQKADGTVHEYALDNVTQVSFGENSSKQRIRTITYFANDGTDASQASESHVAKPAIVGDGVTFTREGYTVISWNTKPDGSGVTFESGEPCVSPTSLALFAQWKSISGTESGHKWVDLGLPSGTKWATTNVGADTPEAYGDYFAWGETESKDTCNYSTYKYGSGEYAFTKYCIGLYGKDGFSDNKALLDKEDDAAAANWGGNWRMPTYEEYNELLNSDYCSWVWTTQSGVYGYLVTSKITGASLFLPAAGSRTDSELSSAGSNGFYWSASLHPGTQNSARCLDFNSAYQGTSSYTRCYGISVRPVCP